MNQLRYFSKKLKTLIGNERDARLFVCSGNPYQCSVFIVGCNPATKMSAPFWSFWNDDTGFDKAMWRESYQDERLKNGKKNLISPTRRRIEKILQAASLNNVLETNVYSVATTSASELGINDKRTEIFKFLLSEIMPKVVLVHGNKACDAIADFNGFAPKIGEVCGATINGKPLSVISVPHFSSRKKGAWSPERNAEIGATIRNCLESCT